MTQLKDTKHDAKALRNELQNLSPAVTLSRGQSLDLAARIKGTADWNTFMAKWYRRYFFDRHEPYLPNRLSLVRALSIRKATLQDATAVETVLLKKSATASSQQVYAHAIERALHQVRLALSGTALVAPALKRALHAASTQSVESLRGKELLAEKELDFVMSARDNDTFGASSQVADKQAEAYSAAYMNARLATLAASYAAYLKQHQQLRPFAQLVKEGEDLYLFAGRVLYGLADVPLPGHWSEVMSRNAKTHGKAALFSVQANGSMEHSLQFDTGLSFANSDVPAEKLLARFPEFAFWQAWVELKPLLADGVDSVVA